MQTEIAIRNECFFYLNSHVFTYFLLYNHRSWRFKWLIEFNSTVRLLFVCVASEVSLARGHIWTLCECFFVRQAIHYIADVNWISRLFATWLSLFEAANSLNASKSSICKLNLLVLAKQRNCLVQQVADKRCWFDANIKLHYSLASHGMQTLARAHTVISEENSHSLPQLFDVHRGKKVIKF